MGSGEMKYDESYHIHIVQHALTRNIAIKFPEVQDEIRKAFADVVNGNTRPGEGTVLSQLTFRRS